MHKLPALTMKIVFCNVFVTERTGMHCRSGASKGVNDVRVLLNGHSAVSGLDDVLGSVRFNRDDGARLSRTF